MNAIQDLDMGSRIQLKDMTIVEVVDNPRDGMWIVVRRLPDPANPGANAKSMLCHVDDVLAIIL